MGILNLNNLQMADKKAPEPTKRRGDLTEVAEDQNWRSYVNNENMCAERWSKDWGFLSGSADRSEPIAVSRPEKIAQLEAELSALNARSMVTTNHHYGTGLKPKEESATYHTQTYMDKTVNMLTLKRA